MDANSAVIHDWRKRIAQSFGVAGWTAIAVAFLVLLPFDFIAVTRLTGWDWAIALAAAIALNFIPVAGQLAYVGLAVAGAFYLGLDNLAERRATPTEAAAAPSPGAGVSTPAAPTDTFLDWKKNVAGPAIQNSCINDAQRRGLVDGAQIEKMARACACYGAAAVNVIAPGDVANGKVQPTPEFNERLSFEARRICQG